MSSSDPRRERSVCNASPVRPGRNPIIVALDVPTAERAVELATLLAPEAGAFKIGKELFTSAGPEIVRRLRLALNWTPKSERSLEGAGKLER